MLWRPAISVRMLDISGFPFTISELIFRVYSSVFCMMNPVDNRVLITLSKSILVMDATCFKFRVPNRTSNSNDPLSVCNTPPKYVSTIASNNSWGGACF